jgi:hypothetical protein
VENALAELKLALSPEKTRTVTFDSGFRFLGAEIQGEAILLPFEKPKLPKTALWVAPPMPPALLRAFCQGGLTPQREFQWRDHSAAESTGAARNSASAKSEDAASRLRRLLSGSPGPNLQSLRRAV